MADPEEIEVSDYEGSLLALTLRNQPISAHQLLKMFERSPVSSLNRSKGNVYPLIRRLKDRGLLMTQSPKDGRSKEYLVCTAMGEMAVKQWVKNVSSSQILVNDPLRTKIISLGLLSRTERLEWVDDVQAMVARKISEVEEYNSEVSIPFQEMVYSNTMKALTSRLVWLNELRKYIQQIDD